MEPLNVDHEAELALECRDHAERRQFLAHLGRALTEELIDHGLEGGTAARRADLMVERVRERMQQMADGGERL